MFSVAKDEVEQPREWIHPTTGMRNVFTTYLGNPDRDASTTPYALLVEFPNPNGKILGHFHDAVQFQVVVRGDCRIGRHRSTPVSVHYTDAYTTYGPIIAGGEGVSFFTLRNQPGSRPSQYMPQSKAQLRGHERGREITCHVSPTSIASPLEPLIEPHADGLVVAHMSVEPDSAGNWLSPRDGGGQYYMVINGSLRDADRNLAAYSLLFVRPDEPAPVLTAGPEGAHVVCMQFPRE